MEEEEEEEEGEEEEEEEAAAPNSIMTVWTFSSRRFLYLKRILPIYPFFLRTSFSIKICLASSCFPDTTTRQVKLNSPAENMGRKQKYTNLFKFIHLKKKSRTFNILQNKRDLMRTLQ